MKMPHNRSSKTSQQDGKAIAVRADLSQSQQVAALFDRTEQQLGIPDIVVNVAGIRWLGANSDLDDDTFEIESGSSGSTVSL